MLFFLIKKLFYTFIHAFRLDLVYLPNNFLPSLRCVWKISSIFCTSTREIESVQRLGEKFQKYQFNPPWWECQLMSNSKVYIGSIRVVEKWNRTVENYFKHKYRDFNEIIDEVHTYPSALGDERECFYSKFHTIIKNSYRYVSLCVKSTGKSGAQTCMHNFTAHFHQFSYLTVFV